MEYWPWINFITLSLGVTFVLFAQTHKTELRPEWYKAKLLAPFGWKKSWWNSRGFAFQVTGIIFLYFGLFSSVIFYWGIRL